ncbi:hypothetical protein N7492_002045 [Penicillium capsulatum]|uniref:Uncharacterized protein n=1 Tax=Penicillium capsulatum TaxID=69766 RepID=A0A9W9IHW2_9EURO|nr:hypothetical protein N7492_002045 [Penicillium capsulatum]KAJ6123335.1 hypothetical protein N7512_005800 [Penicillium capsulatum]
MRWLLGVGLLSLGGRVLAGEWKLDSSCQSSPHAKNVTSGMNGAFRLASQVYDYLEDIANKKPLSKRDKGKHEDEIRQIIQWTMLKDKEELNENTDFGALRLERLKTITGSSKQDDKATAGASTVIVYCDNSRYEKIERKGEGETTRWHDKDFDRIVTVDPDVACKGTAEAYVIDSQQAGKPVNQLQICKDWLKSVVEQSDKSCDKWCWQKVAQGLKKKDQAPIDAADELSTTLFFALLFTTTKDTVGTACKTKWKRAQDAKDDLQVAQWANRMNGGKLWLETTFRGWKDVLASRKAGKKKRDAGTGKTGKNDPSAIALCAQGINQVVKKSLMVNEKGELNPSKAK